MILRALVSVCSAVCCWSLWRHGFPISAAVFLALSFWTMAARRP